MKEDGRAHRLFFACSLLALGCSDSYRHTDRQTRNVSTTSRASSPSIQRPEITQPAAACCWGGGRSPPRPPAVASAASGSTVKMTRGSAGPRQRRSMCSKEKHPDALGGAGSSAR